MSQNLSKRIFTSFILLILFLIINFGHQYVFNLSLLIISTIICIEANKMYSKLSCHNSLEKKYAIKKFNFKFLILNLLTFCYIFFIFCNFSYIIHVLKGPTFFLYIISICFFTDIGGYVFGKTIGGKKLSKISPNKTISGTIGSFISSIIPLMIFLNFEYFDLEFNLSFIMFNLTVSLASQLGDLSISFLKRKAKVKDTGKILPGHGGILDRMDGIIFAVPLSYFLLKLI
ncbi:phosphatidate cytidylyltransferase [Candidatus Pelagibacter bacterium nBUS_25]|uniref:phosphatidate cytidylyltransferase n=1 Tax=Candidatus Pelagibacter bacterium nBUS_25 TaxID=3374187 RepID=UPI003EB7EC34